MSLLKWKKLAKQKKELGNKINFVHDAILKNQLGEKISQESFQKVFKPITTKLDDIAFRNMNIPQLTKKRGEKPDVPNYGIALEDEDIPDYRLDEFFDEGLVPENEKQIESILPTYEESLKDIIKDYPNDPVNPNEAPPGYEEIEGASANLILDDLGLTNYDNIEKQLERPEMSKTKITKYLEKNVKEAITARNKLNGYKSQIAQSYNKGKISEAEKEIKYERIDKARKVTNQ